MKKILIKIIFGVAIFFILLAAFVTCAFAWGEPGGIWYRISSRLEDWYDKEMEVGE